MSGRHTNPVTVQVEYGEKVLHVSISWDMYERIARMIHWGKLPYTTVDECLQDGLDRWARNFMRYTITEMRNDSSLLLTMEQAIQTQGYLMTVMLEELDINPDMIGDIASTLVDLITYIDGITVGKPGWYRKLSAAIMGHASFRRAYIQLSKYEEYKKAQFMKDLGAWIDNYTRREAALAKRNSF